MNPQKGNAGRVGGRREKYGDTRGGKWISQGIRGGDKVGNALNLSPSNIA